MTKERLIGVESRQKKDGTGPIITKTTIQTIPEFCKECGTEPRAKASSRCEKCSFAFQKFKMQMSAIKK